jgi:RimJ/RimL family protein N-acetyltransferase
MSMTRNDLSVRETAENDLENIVDYFLNTDKGFLTGMGVDILKLPKRNEWLKLLSFEYQQSINNKKFFYVTWLLNNIAVGHSNINKIIFCEEAYMHIHMWDSSNRQKGIGPEFIKMSLPYYFDNFKLKRLYCEPYALNPAPNNALEKSGFKFIEQYETIPGWLNFHQPVNKWYMDLEKYQLLSGLQQ